MIYIYIIHDIYWILVVPPEKTFFHSIISRKRQVLSPSNFEELKAGLLAAAIAGKRPPASGVFTKMCLETWGVAPNRSLL